MNKMLPNLNVIFISSYSYYAGNNVSVIKLKHSILFILDVVLQLVPQNSSRQERPITVFSSFIFSVDHGSNITNLNLQLSPETTDWS